MSILAIDFGGTRIRAALFSEEMKLLSRTETYSQVHEEPQAVIDRLIATGREVAPDVSKLKGIGIAAPGPLNAEQGIIYHAKTLPGWSDIPLRDMLQDAFPGVPAFMQNDGNLGALAEYHLGAGNQDDPMIYMTISTGIGGGAIINGSLFTGASGLAIEPGHMRFRPPDGTLERLETLASGTALGVCAAQRLENSDVISNLRGAPVVDGKAVGQAALAGDLFARQVIEEAGMWLGLGLVNVVHLFNPRAIILGGSVTNLGSLLLDRALYILRQEILDVRFLYDDLIRFAQLGDDVCLFGAAIHARLSINK